LVVSQALLHPALPLLIVSSKLHPLLHSSD
jgi:hypothetical protein